MTDKQRVRKYFLSLVMISMLALSLPAAPERPVEQASAEQLGAIQKYIKESWHTLARSNAQLAKAAVDPKFHPADANYRWPVYIPASENLQRVEQSLRS